MRKKLHASEKRRRMLLFSVEMFSCTLSKMSNSNRKSLRVLRQTSCYPTLNQRRRCLASAGSILSGSGIVIALPSTIKNRSPNSNAGHQFWTRIFPLVRQQWCNFTPYQQMQKMLLLLIGLGRQRSKRNTVDTRS